MNSYNGFSPEQRNKAQRWLNKQWAAGTLKRPDHCVACGQTEGIFDAHAEDYGEPFQAGVTDGYHLCFRCHMTVHCRFRAKNEWNEYRRVIREGYVFPPVFKRDFGTFKQQLHQPWGALITRNREAVERTVLDDFEAGVPLRAALPAIAQPTLF
jgi:hypothetical protein